jgi:hypothetical protein
MKAKLITTLLIATAFTAHAGWFKELFMSETDVLYSKAADEIIERDRAAAKAADEDYERFVKQYTAEAAEREQQKAQLQMEQAYRNSPQGKQERLLKRMADDIEEIKSNQPSPLMNYIKNNER